MAVEPKKSILIGLIIIYSRILPFARLSQIGSHFDGHRTSGAEKGILIDPSDYHNRDGRLNASFAEVDFIQTLRVVIVPLFC